MDNRIEFIYLSEPDTIKLGIMDAPGWVDVCEEVFTLLAKGDYLMGGSNHNSHGMGIIFPKESPFPNMPVAGPDRRFFAMPAYLGGRFDVCGNKWYGSNAANTKRGLPRSILTVLINDKETGAPLCHMSANLLSATRTGAIPGVAVRHLARKDSKAVAVVGCGPINKSCFRHLITQAPQVEKVFCYDLFVEKAQALAEWIKKEYGIEAEAASELPDALKDADIVTVAASRIKPLHIESSWLKKGVLLMLTGPAKGDDELWTGSKIVYDNIKLHEAYVEEAYVSGDVAGYYAGVIGGPLYTLIDQGKLAKLEDSTDIGNVILGKKPGRTNDEENIVFVACGMAVFDVACGFELYQRALKQGVGQKLLLWNEPYLK